MTSSLGWLLFSHPAICSGDQLRLSCVATARRRCGCFASLHASGRRPTPSLPREARVSMVAGTDRADIDVHGRCLNSHGRSVYAARQLSSLYGVAPSCGMPVIPSIPSMRVIADGVSCLLLARANCCLAIQMMVWSPLGWADAAYDQHLCGTKICNHLTAWVASRTGHSDAGSWSHLPLLSGESGRFGTTLR